MMMAVAGDSSVPCPKDPDAPDAALFLALVKRFDRAWGRANALRTDLAEVEAELGSVRGEINTAARKRGYEEAGMYPAGDVAFARRIANAGRIEKLLRKAQLTPAQIVAQENAWRWNDDDYHTNGGEICCTYTRGRRGEDCMYNLCGKHDRYEGYWECRYYSDLRVCDRCFENNKHTDNGAVTNKKLIKLYKEQRNSLATILADEHRTLYRDESGTSLELRWQTRANWRVFGTDYADDLLECAGGDNDDDADDDGPCCTFGGKACANELCAALIGQPHMLSCREHLLTNTCN